MKHIEKRFKKEKEYEEKKVQGMSQDLVVK